MTGIMVYWSNRTNSPGWIENGSGCEIWVGARNNSGYGHVSVNGGKYLIHRVRYEREVGPIPEGMELDHFACNNGPGGCCNPRHCRPVTHRENMLRGGGASSLNRAKTHCPKDHPYSADNTYVCRGARACKQCQRDHDRERRKRAASAAAERRAGEG